MSELTELLARLVTGNKEANEKIADQQGQITELLKTLKEREPPAAPNPDAIRAEKIQKINFNLRKSNRLKPFKVSAETDVKLFLKKFEEELTNMKTMVGMVDALTRDEHVPMLRACLDYPTVERVEQVLTDQAKSWDNVTIEDLKTLMKQEFG